MALYVNSIADLYCEQKFDDFLQCSLLLRTLMFRTGFDFTPLFCIGLGCSCPNNAFQYR